jgi:hypothetical protein
MEASAAADPQTSLYETTIDNPELEGLLENRDKLRAAAAQARKRATAAHEAVRQQIETLDIADAPVRIGRFVVAMRPVSARSVSFETAPTMRLVIKPLPEV